MFDLRLIGDAAGLLHTLPGTLLMFPMHSVLCLLTCLSLRLLIFFAAPLFSCVVDSRPWSVVPSSPCMLIMSINCLWKRESFFDDKVPFE